MQLGLTIGDFAQLSHLSVKTLRHYHEVGLLPPVSVDPVTGYRYYSPDQIATAQVVRRFRDLGMPVREVREVLAADPELRASLIAAHLDRVESQLRDTQSAVGALRRLLLPEPPPVAVELRSEPALTVAAIQDTLALADVLAWYDDATATLAASLARTGQIPDGPPGGLYGNELFADGSGTALVYVPVANPRADGRVFAHEIPPAERAVTVHAGPHDDIDVTYGALGTYVTRHGMAVAGPVREVYLCGPRDTPDPTAWRTEIGWPIFRVAG
jgi:DNA-binding transcriptional MerR regulator